MHAKQCIGRAANQYSCLTYTAWVETLYTGIGRTAILFFPYSQKLVSNVGSTLVRLLISAWEELAESLGVTQAAISKRLKAAGYIQKQGNWVPHELKPRDVERRFCMH